MAKYQIYDSLVTSINPSTLSIGKGRDRESIALDIPIIDSNKHKKIIGYVLSVGVNTHNNNPKGFQWEGYLDKENVQLKINDNIITFGTSSLSGYEYIGFPNSFSKQYPITSVFNRINVWLYAIDSYPLTVSNFSCSHVFGDTAKPEIISDIIKSFVDYRKEFSINFTTKNISGIYDQFSVISGTLKYREKGTTGTYTDIPFTGNKAVIPVNTFDNGKTYECYATCTVDDNQTADSQVIELTTVDTKPVLKNIAPINSIEYGDVEFVWEYINESGTEQYAYDLQISTDNISWSNVETHIILPNTKVTKTIQDGTLYWRVKGYNQNDQPSEWSESTKFINRAKPAKPVITKTTSAGRPIIEWYSINQIAYELECGSFKTGQVYTTDKKAIIEDYLPNGNYVIRLRIFNKFGDSSDWLEFDYSQNMNVPQATATISNTKNGVLINIQENLAYKHYILRDDVLIHKGTNFLDKYVCGTGKYTIRRVDNDDNFSDLLLPYDFVQKEITLVELNGNEHDLGNSIGTISVQSAVMLDSVDVQYLGAEKPTFINGTLTTRQWNLDSVYDKIPLGEIMFLRLFNGDSAWVIASSYGNTSTKSYRTMQVTLKEVYYDESIKY